MSVGRVLKISEMNAGPKLAGYHWEEMPWAMWPEHVEMKQAWPKGRAIMAATLSGGICSPPPQPCSRQLMYRTDRSKMEAQIDLFPTDGL